MTAPAPLRIGVDARELLGESTGVGRYLSELLRRWVARPDASSRRFVLFAPAPLALPFPADRVEARVLAAEHGGTWWEQTTLRLAVRKEPLDVFFAPAYTAPIGVGVPLALTIHDVSFLAHPEWFRPRERVRRRLLTRNSARAAAVVLTDSAFSKGEIITHCQLAADKVVVIPPGVSPRHSSADSERREPLVLYVGAIFNRRRLPQLIQAFAMAIDSSDARLVIVGPDRTWPAEDLPAAANRFGVADRVEFRQYVSDAELASLYSRASVFVFLSEYEGFGLTPLEALAADVPIVVLDTPVAREVYGPAATYVAADANAFGASLPIRHALNKPVRGAGPYAAGVLRRYSWESAADRTLDAIEDIARGRQP